MPFCQGCGREIAQGALYCPFCGRPASPTATVPSPAMQPMMPPRKSHRNLILAIVGIVVVSIIVLGVVVAALVSLLPPSDVYVSAANTHGQFTVTASNGYNTASEPVSAYGTSTVDKTLREGEDFAYSMTLPISTPSSCSSISFTISSATLETPGFTLDSVTPRLPITINAGSVTLTLSITAPRNAYSGSLDILLTGTAYCTVA